MTPSKVGQYCSLCEKDVHDLRKSNFSRIKAYADEHGKDLCIKVDGRRANFTGLQRAKKRKIGRFAAALILAFGTSLFAFGSEIEARHCHEQLTDLINPPKAKQHFYGKAVDAENGLPLSNTKVVVYCDRKRVKTVMTDDEGNFDVVVGYGKWNEKISFYAKTKTDYQVVEIDLEEQEITQEVQLVPFQEPEYGTRRRFFVFKTKSWPQDHYYDVYGAM